MNIQAPIHAEKTKTKTIKAKKKVSAAQKTDHESNWQPHATSIARSWQKTTASVIETGRLLNKAKDELAHGTFQKMIKEKLPFGPRTAQMLMAVASNPRLSNAKYISHLPASWVTLYELSKLSDKVLDAKIADGSINSKMEHKHAAALVRALDIPDDEELARRKMIRKLIILALFGDDDPEFDDELSDPLGKFRARLARDLGDFAHGADKRRRDAINIAFKQLCDKLEAVPARAKEALAAVKDEIERTERDWERERQEKADRSHEAQAS